jgi:hypothetical protein
VHVRKHGRRKVESGSAGRYEHGPEGWQCKECGGLVVYVSMAGERQDTRSAEAAVYVSMGGED